MRLPLLVSLLLVTVSTPAIAQREENVERRVDRIERELRAVQRRVFPGGAGATVEPEIVQQQPGTALSGVPASNAVADLNARVDALESQLRALTGQAEENGFRLRQLEATLNQLRADTDARLKLVEPPAADPNATGGPEAASDAPAPPAATAPSGDPGEEAYLAGYRFWTAGNFPQAQKALGAMIKAYPKHTRTSYARNLLGRAYLDDGKPATAAKEFLANYQQEPKGERAADSLYFLGQALVKLNKPAEACKVYDELQDVYGAAMRDWVKQRIPQARRDAKCA